MKKVLITGLLLVIGLNANAQFSGNPAVQSPVNAIQEAVLQQKYDVALNLIKAGLQASANQTENLKMIAIYSKLLNLGRFKKADLGWVLPPGISDIRIRVARIHQNGSVIFKLGMSGQLAKPDTLDNLVVTKYPNIVVLDKNKKIGSIEIEPSEGGFNFSINSSRSQLPVPSGYYQVTMTSKDGEKGEGWFVLDEQMNASANPYFNNLSDGQVLNGYPSFSWNSFKTPEYRQSEWRGNYLSIGKLDSDSNWTDSFGYWDEDGSEMTSVTVGTTPVSEGKVTLPLENGNYLSILGYNEVKKIGLIKFVRRVEVRSRFSVLNK